MAANPLVDDQGNPIPAPGEGDSTWFTDNAPPASGVTYDQINALYQKYLGRAAKQDEYQSWISGKYGATDLAGIEGQIKTSGEAQAHAGTTSTSTGSSDWIGDALKAAQSTDDPAYWRDVIAKDPKVAAGDASAIAYWKDRIARGDGALAVRNGTLAKFQDSPRGGTSTGALGSTGGAPPGTLTAYGVPTSPFQSQPWTGGTYTPPTPPAGLQTPYVPKEWTGGDFVAPTKPTDLQSEYHLPTQAELEASPGYLSRLALDQLARERSAAAHGSILSGGTQLELGRAAQDYASGEYKNLVGETLDARKQNVGEYDTSFNNAFDAYKNRYGQFLDANATGFSARQQNENEYTANVLNPSLTSYNNQYTQYLNDQTRQLNDYLTNYNINRTGIQDFLGQNNKVVDQGLQAVYYGRPG